jgi:tetratricopeptide (TPR) repeat protein
MRVIVATAVLLLALPGSPRPLLTRSQLQEKPEEIRAVGDYKHYHAMVVAYRGGDDDVVTELLTWEERRLRTAVGVINSNKDPYKPWSYEFLRSAALMHTAAALKCVDEGADESMLLHFKLAADLLNRGSAGLGPFAGRWYYAISRLFRSLDRTSDSVWVLELGRNYLPSDPLVLYDSGILEEMFATRWQKAPVGTRAHWFGRVPDTEPLERVLRYRSTTLDKVHEWLRQSVAAAPENVTARLHFGRVLMMRKADDEALRVLAQVRDETSDRATAYLAILFSGGVYERKGLLDEAATAYRKAIERFPEAHSAYVALSEVLQASGHGDEARVVLREMLVSNVDRHEPWAWYFLEPRAVARARLAALFAEGRR